MSPPRPRHPEREADPPSPLSPATAARLRRELGDPVYALLAESELLLRRGEMEGDEETRAAGERIRRLGRRLAAALRDLR